MNRDDNWKNWIPLYLKGGCIEWGYMGRERFVEPFCQETLQKLAAKPFNQLFRRQSNLAALLELSISDNALPLSGIVFHMSRCGSTLVAQSLAALPNSVVLSEPEPFDKLLQWLIASQIPNEAALLRGLICAMGQPRRSEDRQLFLKTDCWHICHIDRILSAFPGVPWLFLYRDPIEVLVSQQRRPASYLIPGALARHGLYPPVDLISQPLEHSAWVLKRVLRDAAEAMMRHPGGILLNYHELPLALETRLAEHFSLNLGNIEIAGLRQAGTLDTKNPYRLFQPDSEDKHADADADLHAMATHWLGEAYAELERMRSTNNCNVQVGG